MSSQSPTEAAAIVNAVVDAYLKNATTTNYEETDRADQAAEGGPAPRGSRTSSGSGTRSTGSARSSAPPTPAA